jgi:hypothetical protein
MIEQINYLFFHKVNVLRRKTKVYEVTNRDNFFLGTIQWSGRWRQYVFQPNCTEETQWSRGCLRDIAAFIEKLMMEREYTKIVKINWLKHLNKNKQG